jgi:cyclophilin family peptidyl-prolyl cis-trans isomerase
VRGFRRNEAETAHHLCPCDDPDEQAISAQALSFARREDSRHDHGSGMDRPPFERVVEVFTVRGGSVHQRGAKGIESAAAADHRTGASISVNTRERGSDVIGMARGHAKAGHVE